MNQKTEVPKIICIDFDGVISDYSNGYQGRGVFGKPIEFAMQALKKLKLEEWYIIIFTTRSEVDLISDYLNKNMIKFDEINASKWTYEDSNKGKPFANIYLDDRALTYKGNWFKTLEEIDKFEVWYE